MSAQTMLETCLVLVVRDEPCGPQVLLGRKRRGFGRGRIVAPGGKIDAGESARAAAARELLEETGLRAHGLRACGVLEFGFPHDDAVRDMRAHLFLTADVDGAAQDSDEIAVQWVALDVVPYDAMWPDARHWLPRALRENLDHARFVYAPGGRALESVDLSP